MWFCQFCAGTDYTLLNNGSLIICNICQRRFNREDDPLVEEISEPAANPDMGTGAGGDSGRLKILQLREIIKLKVLKRRES